MFSLVLLLNIPVTILRSVRNTLAVVELGSGAHVIPYFEFLGVLPASLLMTWVLTRLLNRFSIRKTFMITIFVFISFFILFSCVYYPLFKSEMNKTFSLLSFYVMAELWKPALIVILFWGFMNSRVPLTEARILYPSIILGGTFGSSLSGPIISWCTSETSWNMLALSQDPWTHALMTMMMLIAFVGIAAAFLFARLSQLLAQNEWEETKERMSLKESIPFCLKHSSLKILAWIVIADYIAYSLGELVFLDILKLKFPDSCAYCNYLGTISSGSSILTILSALLITPFLLKHYGWTVAALATPCCLLLTETAFFVFLRGENLLGINEGLWINIVVFLGSLQYCLCRAAKYTLFDTTKELAFVHMAHDEKMKGKLVIDGITSKVGRGGSSALNIFLIMASGSVQGSSLAAGIIAIGVTLGWIVQASNLGSQFKRKHAD